MGSQEAGTVPVLRLCKSTCLDLRSCLGSDNTARPILIFENRQTLRGNVSVKGETGLRWGLEERFGASWDQPREAAALTAGAIDPIGHTQDTALGPLHCLLRPLMLKNLFSKSLTFITLFYFLRGEEKKMQKNTLKPKNI